MAISLDKLQSEKNGGQGFVIPTLISMRHRILFANENGNALLKLFQEAMLKVIDRRFSKFFQINQLNRDLVVATISTPRFKSTFMNNDTDFDVARKMFLEECLKLKSAETPDQVQEREVSQEEDDDFYVSFSTRSVRRNSLEQNIEGELNRFLEDSRKGVHILHEYPTIKEIYIKFNTTLSASAVVDRLYSISTLMFTPQRNRMSPENFEHALLLKYNMKLIK